MSTINSGQCACGAVRIQAAGTPVAELHCQCRQCQLRSGTGHSSYMVFAEAVKIDGATSSWSVTADSGNEKLHAFCPDCGTPTHVTFPAKPGVTAISAALLDSADRFAPKFVTYTSRALPWDRLDPVLTRFDEMPNG